MNSFDDRNLSINGTGSSAGGDYDVVKINGSGRITSDIKGKFITVNGEAGFLSNVEAEEFKVNGGCVINGSLKSNIFKVSGTTRVEGDVNSNQVKISGDLKVHKNLLANKIYITGFTKCEGSIKGETVQIYGEVTTAKDLEGEIVKILGSVEIDGLLNAEELDIEVYGISRVKEIGAGTISIKDKGSLFMKFMRFFKREAGNIIVETIEGDNIHLENTTAKIVRGNNIVIGKGCNIELVEYRDSLNITDDAKVDNSKEIDE